MSFDVLEKEMPRLVKELLQLAEFGIADASERHITWTSRTGRAAASLLPGTAENIHEVKIEGTRATLEYGSRVPYFKYLEEGTKRMIAHPAIGPGIEQFIATQWGALVQEMVTNAVRIFNA